MSKETKEHKLTKQQATEIVDVISNVLEKHGAMLRFIDGEFCLTTKDQVVAIRDLEPHNPIQELPLMMEYKFVDITSDWDPY